MGRGRHSARLAVLYFFIPPFRSLTLKPSRYPVLSPFVACEVDRELADLMAERNGRFASAGPRRTGSQELRNEPPNSRTQTKRFLTRLTEQKRTEEALQVTRTELARVARITTIGELTASIAHEVNQPLAAVVANADACVAWLSRQDPNLAEARAAAERTIQGATRASEVIVRIRSLINKATPEKARVQINEIIEETVALAEGQASRNDVSLVSSSRRTCPRCWATAFSCSR